MGEGGGGGQGEKGKGQGWGQGAWGGDTIDLYLQSHCSVHIFFYFIFCKKTKRGPKPKTGLRKVDVVPRLRRRKSFHGRRGGEEVLREREPSSEETRRGGSLRPPGSPAPFHPACLPRSLARSYTVAARSTHTYWPSQKFILSEVHPLYYVPAVIEHSADVFRVHGACEVRVAIMLSVTTCRAYPLQMGEGRGI